MTFPTFWIRLQNASGTIAARGWSDLSLDEATRHAEDRLQRILAALRNKKTLDLDRYSYVIDNVIREDVIDRIFDGDRELAVVSRNAYGSLILNASQMMFVDIDFPRPVRQGWIKRWFGKKEPPPPSPDIAILAKLREWHATHPGFTMRVYRTAAGIRLIVVNKVCERVDEQATRVMQELGSDALYIQLCKSQACFRARLSPKPWRIGIAYPPKRFPFGDEAIRQAFGDWERRYLALAKSFKVCIYLETLGAAPVHPDNQSLIQLHDE